MKLLSILPAAALLGSTVHATYVCPAMPSMVEAKAAEYIYAIQDLLLTYYMSVPTNETFFSTLPMANTMQENGMTYAAVVAANVQGLKTQAMLGDKATLELGMSIPTTQKPKCKFTFPPITSATEFLKTAYLLEATLCGAFIGSSAYFQSPQAVFLAARLSAEHGIHASYIGSHMKSVVFPANSTMLTPAFTPEYVLSNGMGVGYLGSYMNSCVSAPPAPCGGTVTVGPMMATLNGQGTSNNSSTGSNGSITSSSTSTSTPMAFTGGASGNWHGISPMMCGAVVAVVLSLMM